LTIIALIQSAANAFVNQNPFWSGPKRWWNSRLSKCHQNERWQSSLNWVTAPMSALLIELCGLTGRFSTTDRLPASAVSISRYVATACCLLVPSNAFIASSVTNGQSSMSQTFPGLRRVKHIRSP